jgi:protein-disulfide isomerase
VWACALFVFLLIGIRIREYKTDYTLKKELLEKIDAIEQKQDAILSQLAGKGLGPRAGMPSQRPALDPNKVYKIDLGQSPVKGDPNAKVTVVEFSDFQCPFSQRFHPVAIDAVSAYPSGVKYVLKNFPLDFHDQARPAIKALLAANEQGKYWEMMDVLAKNGKEVGEGKFKELAGKIGIDVVRFEKDMKEKDAQWEKVINEDLAAAKQAEVMGTPTFYINGKRTNARTLEEFKKEIDQLLK